jgi:hypothetical protein
MKKTNMNRHFFRAFGLSVILIGFLIAGAQAKNLSEATPSQRDRKNILPINSWLVLGLFENDAKNSGMEKEWIEETTLLPKAGLKTAEKTWEYFDDRLFSRNYDDYQDFYSYYKFKKKESVAAKIAYAHVYVFSEKARKVPLKMGVDHVVKVFLNGAAVKVIKKSESTRDGYVITLGLTEGWNRLLLKVGTQEDGRFGFYATLAGEEAKELICSTGGENGGDLKIDLPGMKGAADTVLPTAWREWPYVAANGWEYLKPGSETYKMAYLYTNPENVPVADHYRLNATGGTPPYRWSLVKGALPPGLNLNENGVISGTVSVEADLKAYSFDLKLVDTKGTETTSSLDLVVKERPSRFYETARLSGLVHRTEVYPPGSHDEIVGNMKRLGHQIVMPISWYNGLLEFIDYWPSGFGSTTTDYVTPFKSAAEKQGVTFGMYMGNFYTPNTKVKDNDSIRVIEAALVKFHPKVFYFDWGGWDGTSFDALFSMIKSFDPEIVINMNGVVSLGNGDWDSICLEAFGFYGKNLWGSVPLSIPWFKKFPLETWRHMASPGLPFQDPGTEKDNDPQEYLRMMISVIGEGCIANMDHSLTYVETKKDEKGNSIQPTTINEMGFWKFHQDMAAWANPKEGLYLSESYTQVDPAPLAVQEWGYSLMNLKRDTLYLHLLKNGWGKTGFPADKKVRLELPDTIGVEKVLMLNQGKAVKFSQTKNAVVIELNDIPADPVDTILKLTLKGILPKASPSSSSDTQVALQSLLKPDTSGNLAKNKPYKLLNAAGTMEMGYSGKAYGFQGNDGLLATGVAAGESWAWIYEVDLKSLCSINHIRVTFSSMGYPTEYRILISEEGKEWKQLADVTNAKGEPHESEFAPSQARYVRVQSLKPDGPNQVGLQMIIAELEVYGDK